MRKMKKKLKTYTTISLLPNKFIFDVSVGWKRDCQGPYRVSSSRKSKLNQVK